MSKGVGARTWRCVKEQQAVRKDGVGRTCLWECGVAGNAEAREGRCQLQVSEPSALTFAQAAGARLAHAKGSESIRALHGPWEVGRVTLIMFIFWSKKLSP